MKVDWHKTKKKGIFFFLFLNRKLFLVWRIDSLKNLSELNEKFEME